MLTFRLAYTGDFLDERGGSAYGDIGLALLDECPLVKYRFLREQAPTPGDASYWQRFYAFEITPQQIAELDGLVVLRPWVKPSTFANGAGDLFVIGRSGTGYDKIDVAACTANDVALFNAPHALNHPTASAALLLILALSKRLFQQDRIVRQGRWDLQPQVMGNELVGRTLSIIGLGHSGKELARLIAPFGMRIHAYSPSADPAEAAGFGVRLTSLEEALREADFLSLHNRLNATTRGMLGAAQLNLMKSTAYFINVARGELVDQHALHAALRDGRLAGAGLDVFETEPIAPDDPLLSLDNVIVAPHWLASTTDVWRATGQAMAAGMLRAARGEIPADVVNREVLDRPNFRSKLRRFAEIPRTPLT